MTISKEYQVSQFVCEYNYTTELVKSYHKYITHELQIWFQGCMNYSHQYSNTLFLSIFKLHGTIFKLPYPSITSRCPKKENPKSSMLVRFFPGRPSILGTSCMKNPSCNNYQHFFNTIEYNSTLLNTINQKLWTIIKHYQSQKTSVMNHYQTRLNC